MKIVSYWRRRSGRVYDQRGFEAKRRFRFSNLFNINPVLQNCDAIIFDDAHGAEQYVADMRTVSASASKEADLYNSLLSALQPGLSESQVRSILDKSSGAVDFADICGHPECIEGVTAILDHATAGTARFAWKLIRSIAILSRSSR
jgi:hypothetical protein